MPVRTAGPTPNSGSKAESDVSATSDDAGMKNYGILWTDPDGTPRASVVSYDKPSADGRAKELVDAKCDKVRVVETKPGDLLQPQA